MLHLSFALLALLLACLAPPLTAKRLAGQGSHFLVLQYDGQVFAVGYNEYGQLGLGTTTDAYFPQPMLSMTNATDISTGVQHSCVLDQGGQVKCAGLNDNYQLGDGTNVHKHVLVPALGLGSGIEELQCGYYSCCTKLASGGVQCWGYFADVVGPSPVTVTIPGGTQSMSQGNWHACFVAVGGKLYCWGYNVFGQLGTGNKNDQTAPTPVVGLAAEGIVSVACGREHTCAVNTGGAMFCWGGYPYGPLGNPGITSDSPNPVQVLSITSGAASAWAGKYNSFVIMQSGTVMVFGRDVYGAFGTGSTGDRHGPIAFGQGVSGVVEICGGLSATCVLLQNDQVQCTGNNLYGQLGVGSTAASLTLVDMTGLPNSPPTRQPTNQPFSLTPTRSPTRLTQKPSASPTQTLAPSSMPVAASDAVVLDANVGAIVGGVVGAVALLLLSAGAFVMWKRRPAKPNSTLAVPQAKPDSAPLTKSDNAVPYAEPV